MTVEYSQKNIEKNLVKIRYIIPSIISVEKNIFGYYEKDSVWKMLEFINEDLQEFDFNKNNFELIYFKVLLNEIDIVRLEKLNSSLLELEKEIGDAGNRGEAIAENKDYFKQIQDFYSQIDLAEMDINGLNLKINSLKNKENVNKILSVLAINYKELKKQLILVSSLLLHYTPDKIFATNDDFINSYEEGVKTEQDVLAIFRYLGQSFYQKDNEIIKWSIKNLQFDLENYTEDRKNFVNRFIIIVKTFLVFADFTNIGSILRKVVVENYILQAYKLSIPVDDIIGKRLAGVNALYDYIVDSGQYADILLNSEQVILTESNITISSFINNFLNFIDDKELNQKNVEAYVNGVIKVNNEFGDIKISLLNLIYLFLHLRECDLVDYNGLLSDIGIKEKMDWSEYLEEITEHDIARIENYLVELNTPITIKIAIINTFLKVDWKQEKYLPQVIQLSDLYEKIYGAKIGGLVYYDEKKAEWVLNKRLPTIEELIK